jgi:hypothetical protein
VDLGLPNSSEVLQLEPTEIRWQLRHRRIRNNESQECETSGSAKTRHGQAVRIAIMVPANSPLWERPEYDWIAVPIGRPRTTSAKPHDNRGASQDRHIAVASFRCVTATCAGT